MIIKGSFWFFLHKNICFGYTLESPQRGDSNEYPQHMILILCRPDKNYPSVIIKPSLSVLLVLYMVKWDILSFLWSWWWTEWFFPRGRSFQWNSRCNPLVGEWAGEQRGRVSGDWQTVPTNTQRQFRTSSTIITASIQGQNDKNHEECKFSCQLLQCIKDLKFYIW